MHQMWIVFLTHTMWYFCISVNTWANLSSATPTAALSCNTQTQLDEFTQMLFLHFFKLLSINFPCLTLVTLLCWKYCDSSVTLPINSLLAEEYALPASIIPPHCRTNCIYTNNVKQTSTRLKRQSLANSNFYLYFNIAHKSEPCPVCFPILRCQFPLLPKLH